MVDIDVEEIMTEIRTSLESKGCNADELSFNDIYAPRPAFRKDTFAKAVGYLYDNKFVPWKVDDNGPKVKGFLKRTLRKMFGFIVAPFANGQNTYNHYTSEAFYQLLSYVEEQNKMLEYYQKKVDELEQRMETFQTMRLSEK